MSLSLLKHKRNYFMHELFQIQNTDRCSIIPSTLNQTIKPLLRVIKKNGKTFYGVIFLTLVFVSEYLKRYFLLTHAVAVGF